MKALGNAWAFYAAHTAEIHIAVTALCGLLYTCIQVMLRFMPLGSWITLAEKSPRVAAFVRILGALGVQPIPFAQALIDLIRGSASPGTAASTKSIQVSSSAPLISPKPSPNSSLNGTTPP